MYNLLKGFFEYTKKRTPSILQIDYTECGASALNMIFSYYKLFISQETIRLDCGISRNGSKAVNIIKAAKKYGFNANGYSLKIEELSNKILPAIIFWDFNHFVVLEYFNNKYFFINDPAIGHIKICREEFSKHFTGILISIIPNSNFQKKNLLQTQSDSYLKLMFLETKKQMLFLGILGLILSLFPILKSGLDRLFIDLYIIESKKSIWIYIFFGSFIFNFVMFLGQYLYDKIYNIFFHNVTLDKILLFIHKLFDLDIIFFYSRSNGEVISRVHSVQKITDFFLTKISSFLPSLLILLLALICISLINSFFGIFILCNIFLTIFVRFFFKSETEDFYNKKLNINNKYYGHFLDSIRNIEAIQSHGLKNYFISNILRYNINSLSNEYSFLKYQYFFMGIDQISHNICLISIFIYGGYLVTLSELSVGDLVALSFLYGLINNKLYNLTQIILSWQEIMNHVERIDDTFNFSTNKNLGDIDLEDIHSIEFNGVSFSYNPADEMILHQVSFKLNKGEKVCIIGSVGYGKSTIIKIILGFFAPTRGEVLINGVNSNRINYSSLYKKIGYVSQNINLFEGSLYQNLTSFQNQYDHEELENILIDFELGYLLETRGLFMKLNEGGRNLSGGERQRIEIVRVLLQKPSLLILDEATSALDQNTENKVLQLLSRANITIIHITHRESVIKTCDRIIDIEKINQV